jgi:NAD(P)-dependent dehydrogenase (short-subunit alcohol dehydrogenase family)
MDLGLNGKIALVTGASRGIGAAIATELAREGADLVICARGTGALDETARRIAALGRQVLAVPADLATADGVRAVIDAALATFDRVDILVNNVGGAGGPGGFMNLQDEHLADGVGSQRHGRRAFLPWRAARNDRAPLGAHHQHRLDLGS